MKISYIMSLLIIASTVGMEKEKSSIKQVPTLKEQSLKFIVNKIKRKDDYIKIAKTIPSDMHCSILNEIIKLQSLAIDDLISLIDLYCNDILLKAYAVIYSKISESEKQKKLAHFLTSTEDSKQKGVIAFFKEYLSPDHKGTTLLDAAIVENNEDAIRYLIHMGEDVRGEKHRLYTNLAAQRPPTLLKLLIDAGARIEDPKRLITDQPLYGALYGVKHYVENIDLLVRAGVNLSSRYQDGLGNMLTIPEYLERQAKKYPNDTYYQAALKLLREYQEKYQQNKPK